MTGIPSRKQLEYLRSHYPPSTRVELISMNDPYTKLRPGDRGTITFFDDIGTAFVDWDGGSCLGLVFEEDSFKRI